MENLETLMGKYGEEGDKLIFRILNNGLDNPDKHEQARADFEKVLQGKNVKEITERALKYDLTIPFARYVAMNQGQLTFPFKRYQIQPVWRADRPGRGRYREFYQCDADIVGSKALLNEVELTNIYNDVFTQLGIPDCKLAINSRKVLLALAELCGNPQQLTNIATAIDKLDKIGLDKVKAELAQRGLNEEQIATIEKYLSIDGTNKEKLKQVEALIGHLEIGKKGIEELEFVVNYSGFSASLDTLGIKANFTPLATNPSPLVLDFTLARGLNYYTGIIFEAKAPPTVKMGSIGGGGRYDDLTGLFGVPNIPGVGISFGVDRIYDVMEELNLFPEGVYTGTQVLFFNMGAEESAKAFSTMQLLRKQGVRCELFHEPAKMDKQFKYAEKKNIGFVVIIGSTEIQNNTGVVKNLKTGAQETIALADLSNKLFI
jgi:histidyl-tRNA synthetase